MKAYTVLIILEDYDCTELRVWARTDHDAKVLAQRYHSARHMDLAVAEVQAFEHTEAQS